jgi:hypothetical protein
MRRFAALLVTMGIPVVCAAQAGKFPPDSLTNVHAIAHGTPVINVIGTMRNFTSYLGVRCQYCHVGAEGQPLDKFDFIADDKRTKVVARQMMFMVQEINRRLDSLPAGIGSKLTVTCNTCHRGTTRPLPLATRVADAVAAAGADSALRTYRGLRDRYYGRDAYDFGEGSLNTAAFRLGGMKKFDEAFAMLKLNEEIFPNSSGMYVFRGNINLMKADTTAAEAAFREAVKRDPNNQEAKGRLQTIGKQP